MVAVSWLEARLKWSQNPAPFNGHEGSTPSSSTNLEQDYARKYR